MTEKQSTQIIVPVDDQKMSTQNGTFEPKDCESDGFKTLHCYDLFLIFKEYREKKQHQELITFLVQNYPANVKNKTFNFVKTGHMFHSLYAYIPAVTNVEKERKQIRLSEECIEKLFVNTINDFKLYTELFSMIRTNKMEEECPCQLLIQRRNEIKTYVNTISEKKFDNKPPKLKKENIDNIMYKYSLNWKNLLLKRKTMENGVAQTFNNYNTKKKRKSKKRVILTDEYLYFNEFNEKYSLHKINGMSLLTVCDHSWVTMEKQLRAGDESVSFLRFCKRCGIRN
ncbi:lef-5 [Sucra jujuba nucleopolyhedrovirus]|uniref:Lef-5 n=1 Tax=Sucra jujuba nucleopolyhedrovirus TaxID=1563660 RepID=A0A097P916_9ABAC|nr:lef-5 [Sucra jujuba nucleopolyhedrovirus]AIU41321.1 lef-5 [Sucra jujuba nucleopolyhedrovirus]